MKSHLICFDLDDTLVHADAAHIAAYKQAFKDSNLSVPSNAALIKHFGMAGREIIKRVHPGLTPKEVRRIEQDHHTALMTRTYKQIRPIRGVKRVLKELKREGYRLAITTNCEAITAKRIMSAANIDPKLFDAIVTNEMVHHPKPSPDEIIKAEHLLHLHADYMVGDTPYDMIAARKAKVKAIAVTTGNHTKAQLKKERPYLLLRSIRDLPQVLKKETSVR